MIESNFYILARYRLPQSEQDKRKQFLENTLTQLRQYQNRPGLKPAKVTIVRKLIVKYSDLLDKIGA